MKRIGRVFLLVLAACADLKSADPPPDAGSDPTNGPTTSSSSGGTNGNDGATNATSPDAASDAGVSDLTGAGVLPSGYCCASNDDCRYSNCVSGVCLDRCVTNKICTRDDIQFTCDADAAADTDGLCRPPSGFTCIPQNQFVRGKKDVGGCCLNTGNGSAASECAGTLCVARGAGPYVCSKKCKNGNDCPSDYLCYELQPGDKECIPGASGYTCQ